MRRLPTGVLLATTVLLGVLMQPLTASAITVTRPALSKTSGITTVTNLSAKGHADSLPSKLSGLSATLTLSKRNSSGTYKKVKSVKCTIKRSGRRADYTAKIGTLSAGRYSAKVKFSWTGSDGKKHSATSAARLFTVHRRWVITMKDLAFSPSTRTVSVGDRVVFKNADTVDHQVRIGGNTLAFQAPGKSVTWVASAKGSFPFLCVIHPEMTGKITVK